MAVGFPTKVDYATGDVLSAANMNDLSGTVNLLESAQYAAGKNAIINGDFGINQRQFTSVTTSVYGHDRWFISVNGTSGTVTYSTQTFTLGTAPVAGYEGTNFAQVVTTGQSTSDILSALTQRIESVRTLAGQTATLSFWAKATSGTPSIAPRFVQSFGTGGSPSANVIFNATTAKQAITTSWARYSFTVSIPSISGKTLGTTAGTDYLNIGLVVSAGSTYDSTTGTLGIQSNTFQIWGVQLEEGSTASAFQTATGTKQGELAACQRYYFRLTFDANTRRFGVGIANLTTNAQIAIPFPVTLRTTPTALEQSGTAGDYSVFAGVNVTCNAVPTYEQATQVQGVISLPVASGLTAGYAAMGRNINTNAYLGWSAEL
jgi:hypothetical protein